MKVICQDNMYRIFGDSLETFNNLPAQVYYVKFEKQLGFYLEAMPPLEIREEKIYGVHEKKCQKVLGSFSIFKRNLGVILSGDKGIGKSLFARLLGTRAIERGYPLLIVDAYIPGIASFIQNVAQECMVMFDEFDKTFGEVKPEDGSAPAQTELLSLFDGMAGGKKLFVITCNSLNKLNEFLVNRPGRFHYHFRFDYPNSNEITEYMQDKLDKKYWGEIPNIISFASKVKLNYDCLRAIAFEISQGSSFKEAIEDLNIINISGEKYTLILQYENGMKLINKGRYLDSFSDDEETVYFENKDGWVVANVTFTPSDSRWNESCFSNCIPADKLQIHYEHYDKDDEDYASIREFIESAKASKPIFMSMKHEYEKIHYNMNAF